MLADCISTACDLAYTVLHACAGKKTCTDLLTGRPRCEISVYAARPDKGVVRRLRVLPSAGGGGVVGEEADGRRR